MSICPLEIDEDRKAERCEHGTMEVSDNTLAQRAGTGDVNAFEELYLRHNRSVFSLCLRMTTNVADSEDLAQEVFIKVFRYVGGFRGESAFEAWLRRLTVNHVLMHFRRRRLHPEVSLDDDQIPVHVVSEKFGGMAVLNRIALTRAINQLPLGYRAVFILFHLHGHNHRELTMMLGHSEGTSKSQLFKARRQLRAWL
ncbi:MAG TPA: RNA polymerase sigma factor [Pyrinomonadaceae bacterium]|nr:RNA polymerase sigma factor [Pyrinomonadaceae bacterium]